MLFLKSNIRKISLSLIISLFVMIMLVLVFIPFTSNDINYKMPNDYIYVADDFNNIEYNLEDYDVETSPINKLSVEKVSNILLNPYPVGTIVFADELSYSTSSTDKMGLDVKELINYNQNQISYQVAYINFVDEMVEDLNVAIEKYNVNNVLVGTFPKTGEVLIDETLANYIIDKQNLKNYQDLINQKVETNLIGCEGIYCHNNLKISGVYQSVKIEQTQNIIVNPKEELYREIKDKEEYIIKFNNISEKKEFIDKHEGLKIVSSEQVNKINKKLIIKIFAFIIGICLYTLLILKDIKYWTKVIKHNNLSILKYLYIVNTYIIYIFLSLIFLIII